MKFGRLLTRRFGKKSARKKTESGIKKKRPLKWLAPRTPLRKKRSVTKTSQEIVAAPPLAPARAVPLHRILTTRQFVRPDERLRSCLEGFLLDQRSEHTRTAYTKDIKRFVKFLLVRIEHFGDEPISRHLFIGYKDWLLNEKLQHTTIDRHLATLRSLFGWFLDEDVIEKNPAERVRFMNPKKISKTVGFSDDEVRQILNQPNLHTRSGALHYSILMTLFFCGLRRSELCAIRTSQISVERNQPVLRLVGKGNSERLVPLVPGVWNSIRHYCAVTRKDIRVDQPLFTPEKNNRTGILSKPLDPSNVFYIVRKYARLVGIMTRVSPHSCRATAISNARDHLVSDRAIQEFAGWASPDMITRYDKRKTAIENSAAHSISYGDVLNKPPVE